MRQLVWPSRGGWLSIQTRTSRRSYLASFHMSPIDACHLLTHVTYWHMSPLDACQLLTHAASWRMPPLDKCPLLTHAASWQMPPLDKCRLLTIAASPWSVSQLSYFSSAIVLDMICDYRMHHNNSRHMGRASQTRCQLECLRPTRDPSPLRLGTCAYR